jgi:N-acetylneuraminic acid mutarotase
MSKSAALLLILVFLIALCLTVAKPVSSSANTAEDTWVEKAPMPTPRAGLGVVSVDDKIYAIGGASTAPYHNQAENLLSINEEYDPTTDTWTVKPSMPTPRAYFAIAAYQNKIYCIGGVVGSEKLEDSGGITHSLFVYSGINEVYDTITETWETKASMPIDDARFQANVVDGKIYAIGSQFTYVYDPTADSWTQKTPVPEKVYSYNWFVASATLANRIFVTGEFETGLLDYDDQRLFMYNTLNDSWSESAQGTFDAGIGVGVTVGVRAPARVYVLGLTNWGYDQVNQAYDPQTGNWSSAMPNPLDQRDFGCVILNDVLYVVGGYVDSETVTDANQAYLPIGFSPLPEISVLSPLTQTYNGSSVSLNFTVNRPVSWMGYSLDGADNVTVAGNLTLTGLSGGVHNVTVYAGDSFETVGASETVSFAVAPGSFPYMLVAVAVLTIVLACVVLILYLRKYKRFN